MSQEFFFEFLFRFGSLGGEGKVDIIVFVPVFDWLWINKHGAHSGFRRRFTAVLNKNWSNFSFHFMHLIPELSKKVRVFTLG